MEHAATQEVLVPRLVESTGQQSQLHCKRCGSSRLFRVFRQGYLQEKIYPLLGFYPWRCRSCHGAMLLRKRKISRSRQEVYQA